MSRRTASSHEDWLRLLEPTGPFFTAAVVAKEFPSGLDRTAADMRVEAKERWKAAEGAADRTEWVDWLLRTGLGWGDRLVVDSAAPSALSYAVLEHDLTLRPDAVLVAHWPGESVAVPRVLVSTYPAGTHPQRRLSGESWSATPVQRMALLCRAVDCELGIVTDGDLLTLVRAPRDAATGAGTWRASLFISEPGMLDSLVSLLNLRRFQAMGPEDTPERLLARSADNQAEITDTLGGQARRAVELLVDSISRGNLDQDGRLLDGVTEHDVYEAAVTVLMRLVILLTAEERGLLPVEDPLYASTYAVSTLKADLEEAAAVLQEQLELRSTAWHRVLATTRAVYDGVQHEQLRVPAYGSRLFDPDRFPFLEGRRPGEVAGQPIPVDDLSMLGILRALQELQLPGELRHLSYKHLEVEQVGHVYESLLDHSAKRAETVVVGLQGPKGDEPEVPLEELETHRLDGDDAFVAAMAQRTAKTPAAVRKAVEAAVPEVLRRNLLAATDNNADLVRRLLPFANLLRLDLRGIPLVFLSGAVYVTETSRKRDSGTAYTTRELAEEVASYALEPLVYEPGPAETSDRDEWRLKPSEEILALKVCDPAIGSGAIAVAACRYLADRLVEAWQAEGAIESTAAEGVTADDPEQLDVVIDARRAVAERCIYGVDRDPMAVEMAKLSLWLVTLAKDRPFSFLDHAIAAGDSLLGVTDIRQLATFHLDPSKGAKQHHTLHASTDTIEGAVGRAAELRRQLEATPVVTVVDAQIKQELLADSQSLTADLALVGDLIIGAALAAGTGAALDQRLQASLEDATRLLDEGDEELRQRLKTQSQDWLDVDLPTGAANRRPLHWPLAFPEVLGRQDKPGFDVVVGNPPFLGGQRITGALGPAFRKYLVEHIAGGRKGSADLVAYFFLRASSLTVLNGSVGFLATNTIAQGDTREVALDWLLENGWSVHRAVRSRPWPGEYTLEVSQVWMSRRSNVSDVILDGESVPAITAALTRPGRARGNPFRLAENADKSFIGSYVLGLGFTMTPGEAAALIENAPKNADVIFPYLNGEDLNSSPTQTPSRWVINFFDWPEEKAREYSDCYRILEQKVRPERQRAKADGSYVLRRPLPEKWWIYAEKRPALYRTIASMSRVLVLTRHSKMVMPLWVPAGVVCSEATVVFAFEDDGHCGVLSSSFHMRWAVKYSSTLETRIRYTPSDVFETFPQPALTEGVTERGLMLDQHRRDLMITNDEGLTKTYNRVHGGDTSDGIEQLRELHVELDLAVADAYGWRDLELDHGFHPTTQGERFTISPAAQEEVLDRLLELNHERHTAEVAAGLVSADGTKGRRKAKASSGGLFE